MKVRLRRQGHQESVKERKSKGSHGKQVPATLYQTTLPPAPVTSCETRIGGALLEQLQLHRALNSLHGGPPSTKSPRTLPRRRLVCASESDGLALSDSVAQGSAAEAPDSQESAHEALCLSPPPPRPNTVCTGMLPAATPSPRPSTVSSLARQSGGKSVPLRERYESAGATSGMDSSAASTQGRRSSTSGFNFPRGKPEPRHDSILPQIYKTCASGSELIELPWAPLDGEHDIILARARMSSEDHFKDPLLKLGKARDTFLSAVITQAGNTVKEITSISKECRVAMESISHLLPQNPEDIEDLQYDAEQMLRDLKNDSDESSSDTTSDAGLEGSDSDGVRMPSQLMVVGPDYQLAAGIFSLVEEIILHGKPVWQKFGTAFCIRWVDANAPPSESLERQSVTPLSMYCASPDYDRRIDSATPETAHRSESVAEHRGESAMVVVDGGSAYDSNATSNSARRASEDSRPPSNQARRPSEDGRPPSNQGRRPSEAIRPPSNQDRRLSEESRHPSTQSRRTSLQSSTSADQNRRATADRIARFQEAWTGWSGWVLCTHDKDNIRLMRSTAPIDEEVMPWQVRTWENVDEEESWNHKEEASITVLPKPPKVVHIFDSSAKIGGTCWFSDDRDGRSSFKKEDNLVTVCFNADMRRWVIEVATDVWGAHVTQVARSNDAKDVLDPSLLKAWQRWDEKEDAWFDDPGLSLHIGTAPAHKLYLSQCVCERATGVYDLLPDLKNGKPSYQKIVKEAKAVAFVEEPAAADVRQVTYVMWWQSFEIATSYWYLDEVIEDKTRHIARSHDPKHLPQEVKVKRWEQMTSEGSQDDDTYVETWSKKAKFLISSVQEAPKEIFLDIKAESKMATARGLYVRNHHSIDGRCSYRRLLEGWQVVWSDRDIAWKIEDVQQRRKGASIKNIALCACDVPDPSLIPSEGATWKIFDHAGLGWGNDHLISICSASVPPRRLYVHGKRPEHALYGVYFLRGLRNGRATYAKESLTFVGPQGLPSVFAGNERGVIFWTGDKSQTWEIKAKMKLDDPHLKCILKDDVPWPSMPAIHPWEEEVHSEKRKSILNIRRKSRRFTPSKMFDSPLGASPKNEAMPSKDLMMMSNLTFDLPQGPLAESLHGSSSPRSERSESADHDDSDASPSNASSRHSTVNCFDLGLEVDAADEKDSPVALFIKGHGQERDGVFFRKAELVDGRPYYQSETEDNSLKWDTARQMWVYQIAGTKIEPWFDCLSLQCDVPDPSVGKASWQELSTSYSDSDTSESSASSRSNSSVGFDKRDTWTIIEEEDEEDMEGSTPASKRTVNTKNSLDTVLEDAIKDKEEAAPQWRMLPLVECVVVQPPPVRIFVVGTATTTDFTGVFTLIAESVNEKRPRYRAERVGCSTPCVIRYVASLKRWVIERVPKMKGFNARLVQDEASDNTMFMLASVSYDAPHPALVNAIWEVKKGTEWVPEPGIYCRAVREPPQEICFFGDGKKYNDVTGTYVLTKHDRGQRPLYEMGSNGYVVRYNKDAAQWMVCTGDICLYMVRCNVPSPVETLGVAWKSKEFVGDGKTEKEAWKENPTLACFEGSMPALQIYATGGHRALAGVYTILFRQLHNQHFAYRKVGTSWHMYWSAKHEAWVIGQIHGKGGLDTFKDKGALDDAGDAWSFEDIPHPHTCEGWHFKGRHWCKGGRDNTSRGVISDAFIASEIGENQVKCQAVEDPPDKIQVLRLEAGKIMAGIYFLHDSLYNGRCAFVKQCNLRKSEEWAVFYNPGNAKWNIDRNGLQTIGKPQAQVSCDSPDPTFVPGSWMVRNSEGTWVTSGSLSVSHVQEAPRQVFVIGAFKKEIIEYEEIVTSLAFNGVYTMALDHNRRPCYKKDLDDKWVLRFHVQTARWILDNRKPEADGPEIRDDNVGTCSACCDSFHPACVDTLWALWHTPDDQAKRRNAKVGKAPEQAASRRGSAEDSTSTPRGSTTSAAVPEKKKQTLNASILQSFNLKTGAPKQAKGSRQPSLNSSSAPSSSFADSDKESLLSVARSNHSRSSRRKERRQSALTAITSMTATLNPATASHQLGSLGPGMFNPHKLSTSRMSSASKASKARSISGHSMRSGTSQAMSYISAASCVSSTGSGGRRRGTEVGGRTQDYESWVDNPKICVVPVAPVPERIYVSSTTPKELEGIYQLVSYHSGRPVYRMVNEDGSFKVALDEDEVEVAAARTLKKTFTQAFVEKTEKEIDGAAQVLSMLENMHKRDSTEGAHKRGSAELSHHRGSAERRNSLSKGAGGRRKSLSKEKPDADNYKSAGSKGESSHGEPSVSSDNSPGHHRGSSGHHRGSTIEGRRKSQSRQRGSDSHHRGSQDSSPRGGGVRFRENVYVKADEDDGARANTLANKLKKNLLPKESGVFDFSHHGYCIRWDADSKNWILGEYAKLVAVEYDYIEPERDIILEGGRGSDIYVASMGANGIAHQAGVHLFSELVSVNGDYENFKFYSASEAISNLVLPATLEFKCDGLTPHESGMLFMQHDAPYPSAYSTTWMMPYDGDVLLPTEEKVQCRCIECPPASIRIFGHRGKPKDVNGLYELQPTLNAGRAKYTYARWEIIWSPRRQRWIIVDSTGKIFAQAFCCAPHPAAVAAHGGFWEVIRDASLRGLQVVEEGGRVGHNAFTRIFENSLTEILHLADNPKALMGPIKNGRKRFDRAKIRSTLVDLKNILTEVHAFGFHSERFDDGVKARKKLAGFVMLEDLLTQGERSNATTASWMESLTELKATLRADRADPTVTYEDGWTALHVVARHGFNEAWTYEAAAVLRAYGAQVDKHDNEGVSPVLTAVLADQYENTRAFIRLLSERAESLPVSNAERLEAAKKLLEVAVDGGNAELRMAATSHRVNVNVTKDNGQCALHLLAQRNQAAGVELLLKEGADPNLQDIHGDTPLHLAARFNCYVTVCILLRMGGSPVTLNKEGKTAYMVAIEAGCHDTTREFVKSMVHWTQIEAVLGQERHADSEDWRGLLRNKIQDLLQLGFDDIMADPLNPSKSTPDRLQLVNHLFIPDNSCTPEPTDNQAGSTAEPNAETTQTAKTFPMCCLQMRGFLIASELMVPLLKLLGDCGLDISDHVKYLSFLRYLLRAGFAAFCGVEANAYVHNSRDELHELFRNCYERFQEVEDLTEEENEFLGQALGSRSKPAWPGSHQWFAHGELTWMSADASRKNLIGALAAFVDIDVFESVQDMCETCLQKTEEVRGVQMAKSPEKMHQQFWETAYSRWLAGCAKKTVPSLLARCGKWGVRLQMRPTKTVSNILEEKKTYRQLTRYCFNQPEDELAGIHILEAGAIPDLVSCSIVATDTEALQEMLDEFKAMKLSENSMELVSIENQFKRCDDPKELKVVRLGVLVAVPEGATILAKLDLVLRRYDILQRHLDIVDEFETGAYLKANVQMRAHGNLQATARYKRRFVYKISTPTMPHGPTSLWWWASGDSIAGTNLQEVPSGAMVLQDPTMKEAALKMALYQNVRPHAGRKTITQSIRSSVRTSIIKQSEEKQRVIWTELRPDGTTFDGPGARLDRVIPLNEPVMSKDDLIELLKVHYPTYDWYIGQKEQADVDRLAYDLRSSKARLMRDPEGQLTAVQDFVVLLVNGPDNDVTLVRESAPFGFPCGPRKTTETLEQAAQALIRTDLPNFMHQNVLEIRPADVFDGAYIMPISAEDGTVPGIIPRAKRVFNIQATIKDEVEPFILLRAALTVDDRCPRA